MKLGSIFASAERSRRGNSTTRSAVPASGGSAGSDLAALSSLNDNPAGAESVVQRMVDGVPVLPGSRVRRLSNSAIALSLASSAVTTRRMSAVVPAEQVRTIINIVNNVFLIIASSCHRHRGLLCARRDRTHNGCAAEQRDELATLHCPGPPVLPTGRIARLRTAGDCCVHPPGAVRDDRGHAAENFFQGGSPKQATPFPRQDLPTARNRF